MAATMLRAPESLPRHLAENVMHFGRVLRQAGLPLGTDRIALALQALQQGALGSRADFHDTLAACFLDRVEHREIFEQAFVLFWRDPDLAGRIMAMMLPQVYGKSQDEEEQAMSVPTYDPNAEQGSPLGPDTTITLGAVPADAEAAGLGEGVSNGRPAGVRSVVLYPSPGIGSAAIRSSPSPVTRKLVHSSIGTAPSDR